MKSNTNATTFATSVVDNGDTATQAEIPFDYPDAAATSTAKPKLDLIELADPSLNCQRQRDYPYASILNGQTSGIFIDEKNLAACCWKENVLDKLTELQPNEDKFLALVLTKVNIAILATTPKYLRFKTAKNENIPAEQSGQLIGLLQDYQDFYKENKGIVDVCEDRLVLFLDDKKQPLHTKPLRIRWKNVALWVINPVLKDFWETAELAFANYVGEELSSKGDKWRSLCILKAEFFGEKTGKPGAMNFCCKVKNWIRPTVENIEEWLIYERELKKLVWGEFNMSTGFLGTTAILFAAVPSQYALPPGEEGLQVQSAQLAQAATPVDF